MVRLEVVVLERLATGVRVVDVPTELLPLGSLNVLDRLGVLTDGAVEVRVLVERVVVCLLMVDPSVLRDGLLRTTGVPADRLVLDEPRERLEDVCGREIVVRLGVLRLDIVLLELRLDGRPLATDLERLGAERRIDALGALLRLETPGADRLGLLDRELDRAAVRLVLLLLELPLFRELLDAKTDSAESAKTKMEKAKIKEAIPARRDSAVLIFDL